MRNIVLASNNANKMKEMFGKFCARGYNLVPQSDFDVEEAEEPYMTFVENALAKARNAAKITGKPTIAEDSGLCVAALHGDPGVISARWATGFADAEENNQKLVREMTNISDKTLYYYCTMVFLRDENDPLPEIVNARWRGLFTEIPKGTNGFAYDPYVYIPHLGKTVAELDITEKSIYSHRSSASRQMALTLNEIYGEGDASCLSNTWNWADYPR